MDIKSFKKQFDKKLDKYLQKKINWAKNIVQNQRLSDIIQHIHTITFAGGKRIRPYCFVMGYNIYQENITNEVREFSITFELLHTMALIHDDIIDEADKRHNVATIHHYISNKNTKIPKRIAEWQAILAWDILLARVYEVIMKPYTNPYIQIAQQTVHTMIQEVILWEMIDVDLAIGEKTDSATLERKNLYKTARYTFARPLIAWSERWGAKKEQIKYLQKIGELLWLAYQLRDDLIDILEIEKDKPTFMDIQEWQQTLITDYIYNHKNKNYGKILHKYMGKKLSSQEIKILKNIYEESGAILFAKNKITNYIKKTHTVLKKIDFKNKASSKYIEKLIEKITIS
jgi:geranylgeranyl diphosphate synthase type I